MSDQIAEIFKNIAGRVDPEALAGITASVQFNLAGGDSYYLALDDGAVDYGQGEKEDPDATISMEADDFKALTSGELNPMMAFMSGKIKVDGDMSTVMKFQSLLTG